MTPLSHVIALMRRTNGRLALPLFFLFWFATSSTVTAADIKTVDGQVYFDAKVTSAEPDGINFTHRYGVAKVPFEKLSKDMQKQYHYDASNAARYRLELAERQQRAKQAAALAESQRQAAVLAESQRQVALHAQTPTPTNVQSDNSESLWASRQAIVRNPMTVYVVGVVLLIAIAIGISSATANSKRKENHKKLVAEAQEYIEAAKQTKGLPTVSTQLLLKQGETAFYEAPCSLSETRAVRHYQSGRVGFRVAKGVWLGGSQGRAVSDQEWTEIDNGNLTITNTRIVFDGTQQNRTVLLNTILSAEPYDDGLEVSVENRQKSMAFRLPNPFLASVIIDIVRTISLEQQS